jgi:hypothetical protein
MSCVDARYLGVCDLLLYIKMTEKKTKQIMFSLDMHREDKLWRHYLGQEKDYETLRIGRMPNTKGIRRDAKKKIKGLWKESRGSEGMPKKDEGIAERVKEKKEGLQKDQGGGERKEKEGRQKGSRGCWKKKGRMLA